MTSPSDRDPSQDGWGTWEVDRTYPAADGEHLIVVSKRTQNYGEPRLLWKTERRRCARLIRLKAQRAAERARLIRLGADPEWVDRMLCD